MKKVILTAVILFLALLAGCGKEDDSQSQYPADGKESEQQWSEEDSKEEQHSGEEQVSEGQSSEQQSESQQSIGAEGEFSFENVSDRVFYFSSGVGAWATELSIDSDGTFKGNFHDADMGDVGEAYPNGVLYYCDFTGAFKDLEKVDEFTYKMKLASLEFEQEPDKKEIIDGVLYRYATAYGLDNGEEFYLYLPGIKLTALPEDYLQWIGYYNQKITEESELLFYGLYNVNTGEGFSSCEYEEQSLSERIAMEISFAEERAAELETKLQEDTTQLDMNTTCQELYRTWDDTLNIVWKLLAEELDDTTMEALRTEERNWIELKESEVKAAGQEYEGGSIQAMTEFLKAAELTKERVYELAEYAE